MFMSFNKVLQGFSLGCPWFKCVASLHRSITGLHPVDICFLNNCFFEFLAVLFSGYLFFTKRNSKSWVQQEFFFVRVFVKKFHYQSTIFMLQFLASANMLWTSITSLDMMVSKAEDKLLVIIRIIEIINYLLSFAVQECKGFCDEIG